MLNLLKDRNLINIPCDVLPQIINSIFNSSSVKVNQRHKKYNSKPWFDSTAYELRLQCKKFLILSKQNSYFHKQYVLSRLAYHKHLRNMKHISTQNWSEKIISHAKLIGLKALFPITKPKSQACPIPLDQLVAHTSTLLNCSPLKKQNSNTTFSTSFHFTLPS